MKLNRFDLMRLVLAAVTVLLATSTVAPAATSGSGKVDFNRDIRPILSDNCYKCHGPDAKQAKAGLRLDLPEIAAKPLKSGKIAVVPGQPRKSTLVQRITTRDKDEKMPPPARKIKHSIPLFSASELTQKECYPRRGEMV